LDGRGEVDEKGPGVSVQVEENKTLFCEDGEGVGLGCERRGAIRAREKKMSY
jgi:hypothetical protein